MSFIISVLVVVVLILVISIPNFSLKNLFWNSKYCFSSKTKASLPSWLTNLGSASRVFLDWEAIEPVADVGFIISIVSLTKIAASFSDKFALSFRASLNIFTSATFSSLLKLDLKFLTKSFLIFDGSVPTSPVIFETKGALTRPFLIILAAVLKTGIRALVATPVIIARFKANLPISSSVKSKFTPSFWPVYNFIISAIPPLAAEDKATALGPPLVAAIAATISADITPISPVKPFTSLISNPGLLNNLYLLSPPKLSGTL